MSVTDCETRFWQNELLGTERLKQVDCSKPQEVPAGTNVESHIPGLSPNEIAQDNEHFYSCRKRIVVLERNSIFLVKDLIHNFLKPGQLVLERFAGTLSTAKSC